MRSPVDKPSGLRPSTLDPALFAGWSRALLRGLRLPPGKMAPPLDQVEKNDRKALIALAQRHGPIFKGSAWGGALWIYVFGIDRGRKLLVENADHLRPVTIDLTSLFPIGFMRQMEGDYHKHYRAKLVRSLKRASSITEEDELATIVGGHLDKYANDGGQGGHQAEHFKECMTAISTDMLLRSIFGVNPTDALYAELLTSYAQLGGSGMVWNIQKRQRQAFASLAYLVRSEIDRIERGASHQASILAGLVAQGSLDATMIGNLIYMVEMGRHDVAGFLRWITWFAAWNSAASEQIRSSPEEWKASEAFIRETLRLEQAERLVRTVKRDSAFEGYMFPKGSMVRVCIWESHKDPTVFEQPFAFEPERFSQEIPEHYAPFGLDRHQCPFGDYSIRLGATFLRQLLHRYLLEPNGEGPATRGLYHWEPADSFAPKLRQTTSRPQ